MRKKEIEKTVNQLKELIEIIEPMYDTLDKLEKICPKTANKD